MLEKGAWTAGGGDWAICQELAGSLQIGTSQPTEESAAVHFCHKNLKKVEASYL